MYKRDDKALAWFARDVMLHGDDNFMTHDAKKLLLGFRIDQVAGLNIREIRVPVEIHVEHCSRCALNISIFDMFFFSVRLIP